MEENKSQEQETSIDLFEYLVVVLKNKEFIIKATLVSMLVAVIVSFIIPPVYQAQTRMLPPQQQSASSSALFASQMSMMGFSPTALGLKSTNDLYIALLQSKPVVDYVAKSKDLASLYKIPGRDDLRDMIRENLGVSNDKRTGLITIEYQDRNPKIAADICNEFVEGLRNLNRDLAITEASQRRLFFEKQIQYVNESLIKAEDSLKAFQLRTGTVKIDDQAKAAIEETAKIRAQISAKEVQVRVMQSYATSENPEFQRLQDEVKALKDQLNKLGYKGEEDDSLLSAKKISSYGTEYIRKMREYKYNESLYEILVKQYEVAKLDEARDAAVIQVVEKAEIPTRRLKPSKRRIVVNTGIYVFLLSIVFVLGRYSWGTINRNSDTWLKIKSLVQYLQFDQLIKDLHLDILFDRVKVILKFKRG